MILIIALIICSIIGLYGVYVMRHYEKARYNSYKKNFKHPEYAEKAFNFCDDFWPVWAIPGLIALFIIPCCLFVLFINYFGSSSELAGEQARYDAIMYQLENRMYITDNSVPTDAGQIIEFDNQNNPIETGKIVIGYGQRELMKEVEAWNSWLAERNENEKNFAWGIFYPKWSDKLEFIDLEKVLG